LSLIQVLVDWHKLEYTSILGKAVSCDPNEGSTEERKLAWPEKILSEWKVVSSKIIHIGQTGITWGKQNSMAKVEIYFTRVWQGQVGQFVGIVPNTGTSAKYRHKCSTDYQEWTINEHETN
jgi:hypothetical protein